MFRRFVVTTIAVMVSFVPSDATLAASCWRPPVAGRIIDPFREPSCPYCAGNRGLEYRVGDNSQVSAVAAGVVTWAGSIAGTRYVVVRHANGWRSTYGRLSTSPLQIGDLVVRQTLIGNASGSFYFGLRVGEDYRDPGPYLGRLVGRPRLVPVDGSAARPSSPRWRCAAMS